MKNKSHMIRVRLNKGVSGNSLVKSGWTKCCTQEAGVFYSKKIGELELQIKTRYPSNVRVQNWADNRVPWIFFKSLLALEAGMDQDGKIKVWDQGKYKILDSTSVLEAIKELSKWTDIKRRLDRWYKEFIEGLLKL